MHSKSPIAASAWLAKGFVRFLLVLIVAVGVAAVAEGFGIARDYGYLHASILTGSQGGQYYALATRLAERAKREHGTLRVIPTEGSIENVSQSRCRWGALRRNVRPHPGRHPCACRCSA